MKYRSNSIFGSTELDTGDESQWRIEYPKTRYQQWLAEQDECCKCSDAACRGVELIPVRRDGKWKAYCWRCAEKE